MAVMIATYGQVSQLSVTVCGEVERILATYEWLKVDDRRTIATMNMIETFTTMR